MLSLQVRDQTSWLRQCGQISRKAATITSTYDGLQIYLKKLNIREESSAYLIREIEVPRWADYSEPNIRAVVASYGLPQSYGERLVQLCRDHRPFHQLRDAVLLTYRLGALFALERYGVDFQFIVKVRPTVLLLESSEVAERVRGLCDLVGGPQQVSPLLCRLLLQFLYNRGQLSASYLIVGGHTQVRSVIRRNQSVLANPPERLFLRLSLLRSAFDCTFDELLTAFIRDPQILGLRPETIRRKQRFLQLSLRNHPEAFEQLFSYGIDTRVRLLRASPQVLARVSYLLQIGQWNFARLKRVLTMTQATFAGQYPGFDPWFRDLAMQLLPEIPTEEWQAAHAAAAVQPQAPANKKGKPSTSGVKQVVEGARGAPGEGPSPLVAGKAAIGASATPDRQQRTRGCSQGTLVTSRVAIAECDPRRSASEGQQPARGLAGSVQAARVAQINERGADGCSDREQKADGIVAEKYATRGSMANAGQQARSTVKQKHRPRGCGQKVQQTRDPSKDQVQDWQEAGNEGGECGKHQSRWPTVVEQKASAPSYGQGANTTATPMSQEALDVVPTDGAGSLQCRGA